MKKIYNTSMIYLIFALIGGVFFREFTKLNNFVGKTTLGVVHTHLFVLGMFFFLTVALFCAQNQSLLQNKTFQRFYTLYNISLPLMVIMMLIRGITQVLNLSLSNGISAMIAGFAGITHILITIALIMFFVSLKQVFNENK